MIIGRETILRLFETWTNRPAHGYLLHGPSHPEKKNLAEQFISRLLGATPTPAPTHPDLIILEPEEGKKLISVDAVRKARTRLAEKPFVAERVVLFVPRADRLQEEGWNALLKTLEEPRAGAVSVFVADSIVSIPPTIRSRVVCLPINSIPARSSNDEATRFLHAKSLGERLEIIEDLSKRCESSDDSRDAWKTVLDEWGETFRQFLPTDSSRAIVAGHGVLTGIHFLSGPLSPRLSLEAAALRMESANTTAGLFPTHLPSPFPRIFS